MNSNKITIDPFKSKSDFTSIAIDKTASICKGKNNVIVSIFDVKKNQFLYCSDSLTKKLGYSCNDLLEGGWKFWIDKIKPAEAPKIFQKINEYIRRSMKLEQQSPIFVSYHLKSLPGEWHLLKHEITTYHIKNEFVLFNFLYDDTQHELIDSFFGIKEKTNLKTSEFNEVHISKRENEILGLLAEGYSSKLIATHLFISTHTVLSHRKNLLENFEVKNTPQLINKATRLNII